jgi:hypothetical protein
MISIRDKACFLACGVTDMRKSINGLAAIVEGSFWLELLYLPRYIYFTI